MTWSKLDRASKEAVLMKFALCFTNFGPYHLARLRALASQLRVRDTQLIGYEVAGSEQTYPWRRSHSDEPFKWITFFPDRALETIPAADCRTAITTALDRDHPDVIGSVGYVRPESMAAARWARSHGLPAILMSESQAIDRPHRWWKEVIKKRRLHWFNAALVGGPTHRDYLMQLGMSAGRIVLGYNAVDNDFFAENACTWRQQPQGRTGLPSVPYFLTVCRFVPEKNLVRLIKAFARYRAHCDRGVAWDLVLCGDGPLAFQIEQVIAESCCSPAIHRPGFLQSDALSRWYAHAGAFVLPSVSEPWGLVVNEAAASGLPLLVSSLAGCAPVLVPQPDGMTGSQFDPFDVDAIAQKLAWMAALPDRDRCAMGKKAAETVSRWGPDRFAQGVLEAIDITRAPRRRSCRAGSLTAKAR
jgi:glycosyltransferase involved in cell wall biosynthesis